MEKLGISVEQVICCGDGFNDISMIRFAGVGVAMGNAQEAVKEAADYICPTNDEDGLVDVINRFILHHFFIQRPYDRLWVKLGANLCSP